MKLYLSTWPPEKQVEQTLGQALAQEIADDIMKLHLAEHDPQHHAWAKRGVEEGGLQLRILLSYWYYKSTDLDALFAKYFTRPYPDVFADSGAFSAMMQGAQVSLPEYAAWVRQWKHLFSVYSNLDVIGNFRDTRRNQEELETMGLAPIPVFHAGSPWGELERLIEQYPYIALGGIAGKMNPPMPWLIECFKRARGRAVFHGFGITTWNVLKALPWYSADSSSWGSGFRYGRVPIFDAARGRFCHLELGNKSAWFRHSRLVRDLGFDPVDFADRRRNDRGKICAISALSYMKAEQWLRRWHGEIYIPGRPGAPGVRAHLADANPARFGEIVQGAGVRLHLSDTSNGINYRDAEYGLRIHLGEANSNMQDIILARDVLKLVTIQEEES